MSLSLMYLLLQELIDTFLISFRWCLSPQRGDGFDDVLFKDLARRKSVRSDRTKRANMISESRIT